MTLSRLEEIRPGGRLKGVVAGSSVEVVSVEWIGDQAVNVVYRSATGSAAERTLYRDDEHRLEVESAGRKWSFDADGAMLRLVIEASRIKLAHFFEPYLTSAPVGQFRLI